MTVCKRSYSLTGDNSVFERGCYIPMINTKLPGARELLLTSNPPRYHKLYYILSLMYCLIFTMAVLGSRPALNWTV